MFDALFQSLCIILVCCCVTWNNNTITRQIGLSFLFLTKYQLCHWHSIIFFMAHLGCMMFCSHLTFFSPLNLTAQKLSKSLSLFVSLNNSWPKQKIFVIHQFRTKEQKNSDFHQGLVIYVVICYFHRQHGSG